MIEFVAGVIVGILLSILDALRTKVPTLKEVFDKVYPEQAEVISTQTTAEQIKELIGDQPNE